MLNRNNRGGPTAPGLEALGYTPPQADRSPVNGAEDLVAKHVLPSRAGPEPLALSMLALSMSKGRRAVSSTARMYLLMLRMNMRSLSGSVKAVGASRFWPGPQALNAHVPRERCRSFTSRSSRVDNCILVVLLNQSYNLMAGTQSLRNVLWALSITTSTAF